jgi:proline iminopeptidase
MIKIGVRLLGLLIAGCFIWLAPVAVAQDTSGTYVSRDADLFYEVHGKGQPIYLLSGGPGLSPEYLRPIVDQLKSEFQVVVLHQRGTGKSKSAMVGDGMDMNLLAADLMHLRRHLKHQEVIVMGHSWSCILAMRFAGIYPEFVKQLVLVAPGSLKQEQLETFGDFIYAGLSAQEQASVLRLRDSLAVVLTNSNGEFSRPEVQEVLFRLLNTEKPGYFFHKSKAAELPNLKPDNLNIPLLLLLNEDLRADRYDMKYALQGIDIPVLMIQGTQDPTGKESTRETLKLFPVKTEFWINQCGHYPWIDQQEEFFNILKSNLIRN